MNLWGGTDPAVYEFPQVQPNGAVYENWFDIILGKPSGLKYEDFANGVPKEKMAEMWRRCWTDSEDNQLEESGEMDEHGNMRFRKKRHWDSQIAGDLDRDGRMMMMVPYVPPSVAGPSNLLVNTTNDRRKRSLAVREDFDEKLFAIPYETDHTSYTRPPNSCPIKQEPGEHQQGSCIPTPRNQIVPYGYRHFSPGTSTTDSNTELDLSDVSDSEDRVVRPPVMICKFCKSDFKGKPVEAFISHLALKEPIECLFCSESFGCEGAWISHCRKFHINMFAAVNPQCHLCQKIFSSRIKMVNHMLTHSKKKNFLCRKCNQTYRTCRSLLSHISKPQKKSPKDSNDLGEPESKFKPKFKTLRKCKVRVKDYPVVMSCIKY